MTVVALEGQVFVRIPPVATSGTPSPSAGEVGLLTLTCDPPLPFPVLQAITPVTVPLEIAVAYTRKFVSPKPTILPGVDAPVDVIDPPLIVVTVVHVCGRDGPSDAACGTSVSPLKADDVSTTTAHTDCPPVSARVGEGPVPERLNVCVISADPTGDDCDSAGPQTERTRTSTRAVRRLRIKSPSVFTVR